MISQGGMFPKRENENSYFPENSHFEYDYTYKSLTQFISRNTEIQKAFNKFLPEDLSNIQTLKEAIKNGDFQDPIFTHANSHIYLLYLFREKEISFNEFLTINNYILAVMQYTNQLSLKVEDIDVKHFTVVKLASVQDEEMSAFIIKKLKKKFFNHFPNHKKLDAVEFDNQLKQLSPVDSMLVKVKLTYPGQDKEIKEFIEDAVGPTPWLFFQGGYYFIPSAALINLIIKNINPDFPVKMAPIFGNIGILKLYKMHQNGFHPINLYSTYVTTNPEQVHELRVGPVPTLLHDMGAHLFLANLLTKNQHDFLFHYFIPKLAEKLNVTIKNVVSKEEVFNLIDLIAILRDQYLTQDGEPITDPIIYFIDSIKHGLGIYTREWQGENIEPMSDYTEDFFFAIYQDRDVIKEKFGVDLEVLCNHTLFGVSGPDLLANARSRSNTPS